MLSYQHGYHAGNFADVVKHFTLTRLLDYLCQKEKPIFYLETHAGKGFYDLKGQEAMKTGEATQGIERLWLQQSQLSNLFLPYFDAIREYNPDGDLRYYPGSPLIALHQLRSQDRLYGCELHPREFDELQSLNVQHSRAKVHFSHSNGLETLAAMLPPPERRGLIFIDPSYEIKTDYRQIPEYVSAAYQRFSTGVYCIWYPIVFQKWHDEFLSKLAKIGVGRSLRVEFNVPDLARMSGCGLWVINPPYVLADELKGALQTLVNAFKPGISSYFVEYNGDR